jgi:hypothetical protein
VFEALASSTSRSSAGVNRSTGSLSTTPRSTGSKGQNGRTGELFIGTTLHVHFAYHSLF